MHPLSYKHHGTGLSSGCQPLGRNRASGLMRAPGMKDASPWRVFLLFALLCAWGIPAQANDAPPNDAASVTEGGDASTNATDAGADAPATRTTLRLVTATRWGTEGCDRIEAGAFGADGSLYLAGTLADAPAAAQRTRVRPARFARPVPKSPYGTGFVMQLDPDGKRVLAYAEFAAGSFAPTSLLVTQAGVYVGGYGFRGLDADIRRARGVLPNYPGRDPVPPPEAPALASRYDRAVDRIRPMSDLGSAPCVLLLSLDLRKIEAATWLEGDHHIFHARESMYSESSWQPVDLGMLAGGDVVVLHDGGITGEDYGHFFAPDYLSRLAPNLRARRWKIEVWPAPVDPEKVARYWPEFKHWKPLDRTALGNTRVWRMRTDGVGRIVLGGWSPAKTSKEPWWCPFLYAYDAEGTRLWTAYTVDPMSGGEDRLGGLVSDTAVRSVAFDGAGNVLASLISDGGNAISRRDPRDWEVEFPDLRDAGDLWRLRARMLFWGPLVRFDAETREPRGGVVHGFSRPSERDPNRLDFAPSWVADMAGLPGGRVVAAGRQTGGLAMTPDAFDQGEGGFVRVYDPSFGIEFSTPVADMNPYHVAVHGNRVLVVGESRSAATPVRDALQESFGGGLSDGYLLLLETVEVEPAEE